MRLFRFTVAGLLGLVVFAAIGAAALWAANDFWDSIVFSLTLMLLLLSILLAIHRTGPQRAFLLGFALVGGVYLLASLVPWVEPRLLSTTALVKLDQRMPGRPINVAARPSGDWILDHSTTGQTPAAIYRGTVQFWDAQTGRPLPDPGGNTASFLRIGHALLAVVLGYVGGFLSQYFFTSGGRKTSPTDGKIAD